MELQKRKELLVRLGDYLTGHDEAWREAQERAAAANPWFTPEFIELGVNNIARNYLQPQQLQQLIDQYQVTDTPTPVRKVGIVMAGNLPLVGFHDFLCVFLTGHEAMIKPSSKDDVLIKHLVAKLTEWEPSVEQWIAISGMIRHCDAYIATGSNNSARYFDHYFGKYQSIIRRNRTSVAVLTGNETTEELERLADDVFQYFGLGCRNVTQIHVPKEYDFIPLINAFKKYDYLGNHNKYRNNYEYNLAVHILNNRYYMSTESILLIEEPSPFSAIAQLHYQHYGDRDELLQRLRESQEIQCIVSRDDTPFGSAQLPEADDYADGVDTMEFLRELT